ncbi:MAG: DUF6569 family protein [Pseudomonadota bacterium]
MAHVMEFFKEIKVGAKQNRVLNATILIAPKSETNIPVSCVEQGRWSYRSKHFGSQSRSMSANLRNRKSQTVTMNLRQGREFRPVFNQVGMIVLIDGETAGIEILNRFLSFREIHSKLVTSYVLDAL